jgi:putative membrane protein
MYRKSASRWRLPLGLLAAFAAVWLALAVHPLFRKDWLLENMLVFLALPLFALTARRLRFSDFAYACLFAFFLFHAIGAHYTYSLVPYADWWQAIGGAAPEGRNQYDRFVHLAYGLLVTPAAVELIAHYARFPRPWSFLVPWMFMAGHAVIYELIEFAAAVAFGGDLGQAYLGTQGDVWDGQKDMALALAGTTVMLAALAAAGRLPRRQEGSHPDFK